MLATLLRAGRGPGHRARPRRRRRRPPPSAAHRPHRAVRRGRRGAHGHRQPRARRPPARPAPPRRQGPRRRADQPVRAHRRRRTAGAHLLRRHAAAARPRRQPRRPPRRAVPRRADHRPRPAAPQRGVGPRPRRSPPTASPCCSTTQYLEEADQLADDLVVLDHGRVIAAGTPAALKAERRRPAPARAAAAPRGPAARSRALVAELVARRRRPTRPASSSVARARPGLLVRVADRLAAADIPVAEIGLRLPSPRRRLPDPHRPTRRRRRGGGMTTHRTGPARARPAARAARPLPVVPARTRPRSRGAGVTKTVHSTEALLDVTLQPVIFLLLFVYVFGGAIAGEPGRLPAVRAARRARADRRVRLGGHRRRARRRPEDRHLRPLPQPADLPHARRCSARSAPTSSATSRPA